VTLGNAIIGFALAISVAAQGAYAADIALALTDDEIAVDASFSGASLTLFGAVTGIENPAETTDIIAVIKGPSMQFEIRALEKKNLIWMAGPATVIDNAPGLYITTATRNVNDIAPVPDQKTLGLRADYLPVTALVSGNARPKAPVNITAAFLTEARNEGLYRDNAGVVEFKKGALFTIKIDLPANLPVGDYDAAVYLYSNGELLGQDRARLSVNKVGLERRIYELAHTQPLAYGLFCVALSLFAGWIASLAFRK